MNAKTLTIVIAGLVLLPLTACERKTEEHTRISEAPPPPTVIVTPPPQRSEAPPPPATVNINPPPQAQDQQPPANAPESPRSTQ